MNSLQQLMSPMFFPLEVRLSSGERHTFPHPDFLRIEPKNGDLVVYSEKGANRIRLVISMDHIELAIPYLKE